MSIDADSAITAAISTAQRLRADYRRIRSFSETIAAPLAAEDCVIQSMPDVSPTRWHLAHTTWFFETFLLKPCPGYAAYDGRFEYLFNSYYNAVGDQFPRSRRGLLSRPTVDEVYRYRKHVDDCVLDLLDGGSLSPQQAATIEIGLNHEQQHQELMLTDIKHVFSCNPLFPAYSDLDWSVCEAARRPSFVGFDGGLCELGHTGDGFAFDNESPRHRVYLNAYEICDRLVTAGEYLEFIEDGGYRQPQWWLSLGWQTVQDHGWHAPLYWLKREDQWLQFTLCGLQPIDPHRPVCHVSYFEADALARWAQARLPTEAEWELAAAGVAMQGHFADQLIAQGRAVHPAGPPTVAGPEAGLSQMFGQTWQWTSSPYTAYPGFAIPEGAIGEYNGKFMCGQFVLRGGSCATPSGHVRPSYRNFFPPSARWQFSGIRLARDSA